MKIALDASYSAGKHLSGVGVYSRELMQALTALPPGAGPPQPVEWRWHYRPHHWRHVLFGAGGPHARFLFENRLPGGAGTDLFHGLGQRLPAAFDTPAHSRHTRSVVTFHDLFVMTREYSSPEFRRRFTTQAQEAARRADAIIAVSRFTAGQIEELLGVEPARIHVVPHGVRPLEGGPASSPREKLILSVGALQLRKNTAALVRAFETLPPGWRLVLAGAAGGGFGYDEFIRPVIEASPCRAAIELTGWVDDAALAALYARASVFAFPSLDEGFGIPALEAMHAGVPVLASNTSSLPEVCGDAALLVDPSSVEAIAEGLRQLMESESLRESLIERGRKRAREFTWERCASETCQVYRQLLR